MARTAKNRHGLSRDIPGPIKRQIRQECGFGCVICGGGLYEYEHIDPEFHDAEKHDPAKMGLVCPTCHGYVTRGAWSKNKVKEHRASPRCLQEGAVRWGLDLDQQRPNAAFGDLIFYAPQIILRVFGEDLLTILPPEEVGAPVRLRARFFDEAEAETLTILDNEVIASCENWDIETQGQLTKIRRGLGNLSLVLRIIPRRWVSIERLEMRFGTVYVSVDTNGFRIGRGGNQALATRLKGEVVSAECCIEITEQAVEERTMAERCERPAFTARGFESIHMEGCEFDVGDSDAGGLCLFDGGGDLLFKNNTITRTSGTAIRIFRDGLCVALGTNAHSTLIQVIE